jgi:pathogenesis-related protein 1
MDDLPKEVFSGYDKEKQGVCIMDWECQGVVNPFYQAKAVSTWKVWTANIMVLGFMFCCGCSSASEPEMPLVHKTDLRSGMLQAHNRLRAQKGLSSLRWSEPLADYAREWAQYLSRSRNCRMQHRKEPAYGENLAYSSAAFLSPSAVLTLWASEEKDFDYQRNRCVPGKMCGHYTQLVWRDTRKVGCALSYCRVEEPSGHFIYEQVWVCNYDPPGNVIGERPY